MMTLWLMLVTMGLATTQSQTEMIELGSDSGIVLKEQPGILITDCRLHTQKVFVRFSPEVVCGRNAPTTARLTSWAGTRWKREVVTHAEVDITHILQQLQKFTITRAELSGANKREKRFIGGLLTAASAIGSRFSLGVSAVNAVNGAAIKRHVNELQSEIPGIQQQLDRQRGQLGTVAKTVEGTVLVLNSHSETDENGRSRRYTVVDLKG